MSAATYKPKKPTSTEAGRKALTSAELDAWADYQATVPVRRGEAISVRQSAGVIDGTRPAGAGLRAEGASSSLDHCTLENSPSEVSDSEPHYRVTLKDFGDGHVTCTGIWFPEGKPRRRASSVGVAKEVVAELPQFFVCERSEFARLRARKRIRESVWMLHADRMLTLTKRGKFQTLDEAWAAWKAFCRLARCMWRQRWQFVCVPEAHRDGSYHLHVALCGFFDVGMLRRLWGRALGGTGSERGVESLGNVDIAGAVSSPRSRTRIAGYLSKYLGKDLGAVFRGRRSVSTSSGIPAPRIVRWNQGVHLNTSPIYLAERTLRELVGPRLVSLGWWEFQCAGGYHGFVLSPREV